MPVSINSHGAWQTAAITTFVLAVVLLLAFPAALGLELLFKMLIDRPRPLSGGHLSMTGVRGFQAPMASRCGRHAWLGNATWWDR